MHAIKDKYGGSGLVKIVGSLDADNSAFLAYRTKDSAQRALDRVLSVEPDARLRPVNMVDPRALDCVMFDYAEQERKNNTANRSSGGGGTSTASSFKVVFGNFPEDLTQVMFARDLIKNGFRHFNKQSLTVNKG